MVEDELLDAVITALTPRLAPARVDIAEPAAAIELPVLVLALEDVRRLGAGLGERAELVVDGALRVHARIDLADPTLPGEPGFSLLSPDRLTLTLPHGGLVRADASQGPLGPADLTVTVAGTPRPVVAGTPSGLELRAEPLVGQLVFATALPASGAVEAEYFLGQWERRHVRLSGVLRCDARAAGLDDVRSIAAAALAALPGAVAGLRIAQLAELGPITPPDPLLANSRGRRLRLGFDYEGTIDRPESSGGIIRRIPLVTHVEGATEHNA